MRFQVSNFEFPVSASDYPFQRPTLNRKMQPHFGKNVNLCVKDAGWRIPLFLNTHPGNVVIDRKRFIKSLLITALFNTIIALFLTHLEFGKGFAINFIMAQCIGLSICASIMAGHLFLKNPSGAGHFFVILITMPVGAVFGSLLGALIAGLPVTSVLQGKPALLFQLIGIGILFGTIITYFFFSQERISQARAEMQEERIKRLDSEKKVLETHLKMLQAQIEPHFLFNSLSTVLSLVETDREKAGRMLTDLIHYLRVSLSKTRAENTTIGQEMEMARAYLDIYKIRMGDRLQYRIQSEDRLKETAIPPMLVQPLLENAVKHGLETTVEGGIVTITTNSNHHKIRITVTDTGKGLDETGDAGFGLTNIRERLHSLYGKEGRVILEENSPSGLKATIEIPHG
jgi:signal transduction histidine kinase